ncbi:pseudouridine synthase [Rhodocollybia butyracea]|uniref:tRNA pseudouridine synthase n=1 Tax=Rhodocollybia butyracea TaxID=206335 RepID=A0A9P5UCY8_9AGAR|nr:pseudouridine synthase [Rhodocollybia butyracea]
MSSSYENWSREDLIARLKQLEGRPNSQQRVQLAQNSSKTVATTLSTRPEKFDFASYPRRKIALKFCYSGWEYNGLAYQLKPTPLPTVEGVIFDALTKTKLIDPDAGYDGCEWEKCGRTDRGVSAAGQVISLWVRSALEENMIAAAAEHTSPASPAALDYVGILNRVLPPTIRILAWSPVSKTFSARFACKYRHYKYFFSSERLDIPKMRDAASRLLGLHDFRNLCKLDPAKQITMFDRKILRADIDPVDSVSPSVYVLNLIGTAFLYHQVRHIMAVLLLVGRGLEHPSVVSSLVNIKGAQQPRDGDSLEVVDCKPEYQMADALPLMLWDCAYSDEDVDWRTDGHQPGGDNSAEDGRGIYHLLHSIRARSEIYLTLNQHFLDAASLFFPEPWLMSDQGPVGIRSGGSIAIEVPLGGGNSRKLQQYVPLLERKRLDPVGVVNERWRNGKGFRRDQKRLMVEGSDSDSDQAE